MKQTIFGTVPSKSNCYKIIKLGNHASLAKTPALKKYENDFYIQCNDYRNACLLYTSPSPRDRQKSRMPSSA